MGLIKFPVFVIYMENNKKIKWVRKMSFVFPPNEVYYPWVHGSALPYSSSVAFIAVPTACEETSEPFSEHGQVHVLFILFKLSGLIRDRTYISTCPSDRQPCQCKD
jgi:hypothetical protein